MLRTGEAAKFCMPISERVVRSRESAGILLCRGGGGAVRDVLHSKPTTSFHEMRTQPNPKIITWRPVLDVMLSENADHTGRETSMPMISIRDKVFIMPSLWLAVIADRNQMFKTMKRGSAELFNRMDRACHFKLKQ